MSGYCLLCLSKRSVCVGEVRLRWPLNRTRGLKAEKTRSNNGGGGGL